MLLELVLYQSGSQLPMEDIMGQDASRLPSTVYCPLQCTGRLIKTDALRDKNNCNALLFQT